MDERKYHYSEEGETVAKDTGLHDALNGLETDVTQELTDHMPMPVAVPVQELTAETLNSAYFEELSEEEQAEVFRNINRFGEVETLSWLVEGSKSSDDLLELPKAESRHSARREDLITLIGASALDFYGTEQKSWLDNWQMNGFRDRLDAAAFATATTMSGLERRKKDPGGSLGYKTGHNTYRNIFLSTTIHGDFHMTQYDTHPHGITAPTGRKVEFAPNGEEKAISSHHSMEPLIATRTLEHLYCTHNSEEKIKSLLEDAKEQIKEDDSHAVSGLFGDYGYDDILTELGELWYSKEQWQEGAMTAVEEGSELEKLMVHPGDHNIRLQIVSFPEYLRFVQTNDMEKDEKDGQCIDIPNDYLADFLAALHKQTKSGAGRTAPEAIEALLETAESDCGNS